MSQIIILFISILFSFTIGFYFGMYYQLNFEKIVKQNKNKCLSGRCGNLITCHKKHLLKRCEERGYALEEVMPCVINQNEDEWTINISHPAYPKEKFKL